MPVEPGGRESAATSGTDGALFAPVPIWERGRKRRRGGRPAGDPAMDAGEAAATGLGEPVDAAYETQPADVGVQTAAPPRRRTPVGAIVLGAAAVAVIAAAGWYASQPHDRGLPELTPGSPGAGPVAYAAPPASTAANQAVNPPAVNPPAPATPGVDAAGRAPATRQSAMPAAPPKDAAGATSRVRPAPSATDAGANASVTAAPTITPPSPGSPSTDPMTVNPAPGTRPAPADSQPSVGSPAPATPSAPTTDPGTTP